MNDTAEQIKELFPEGKVVTLKGKEITVKPFGFGKYPKLLKLLKDMKVEDEVPAVQNVSELPAAVKKVNIGALMAENADIVISICCLAINEKEEFFLELPGDEGVELCQAILEVNVDFFVARLQPKVLGAITGLSKLVGEKSLLSSLPTATV